MARGWARRAPDDELVQVPMSDGGPGFLDVLHAALDGELHAVTVPDPYGVPVPAAVLRVGDTAYVESAQAVGLHLTEPDDRSAPRRAADTAARASSSDAWDPSHTGSPEITARAHHASPRRKTVEGTRPPSLRR